MMVVLTAWERAANLFRAKRSLGTLRLLFLDEANRLSQDNLQMLFELDACRRTRTEVHEAQDLEREISGVYEAGRMKHRTAAGGERCRHE
jgi:chromosome condensin MukBEF ATPase and DNA-binding subunit MukB